MNFTAEQQEKYIRLAMEQAELAAAGGHPPFGAVLVGEDGQILAVAHNTASPADIFAHAELSIIRPAAQRFGRDTLHKSAIFINAASCGMCAAALIREGVRTFYYGAPAEPHTNPAVSFEQLQPFCQAPITIHGGILADECAAQIKQAREAASAS